MGKYAVIDLGTNTFHLLAVEVRDGEMIRLHKERIYVKLAEDGIGYIGDKPYQRGLDALSHFKSIIDQYNISEVMAFGTAALRTASNGVDFIKDVQDNVDIQITRISGIEEARLIHKGVVQAVPLQKDRMVIMDIGGGSVEFIIADNEDVIWSESFPIGVGVLYNEFHYSEPISQEEIHSLQTHVGEILQPFLLAMDKYKGKVLIGASGTFDVLEIMMKESSLGENSTALKMSTFASIYDSILNKSLEERYAMTNIPASRADMIVVALLLIQFVIEKTAINNIIVSKFALKQGALIEMMEKDK